MGIQEVIQRAAIDVDDPSLHAHPARRARSVAGAVRSRAPLAPAAPASGNHTRQPWQLAGGTQHPPGQGVKVAAAMRPRLRASRGLACSAVDQSLPALPALCGSRTWGLKGGECGWVDRLGGAVGGPGLLHWLQAHSSAQLLSLLNCFASSMRAAESLAQGTTALLGGAQ